MARPVYVRVKDPVTKHEWDEPEGSPLIAKGRVELVKGDRYPPSTVIRPTKHFLERKSRRGEPAPAGEGNTTEKE